MEKVKSKKPLSRDLMLKINSVFLAVVIWFILSITLYPTIENTISDIPVTIDVKGSIAESEGLSPIDYEQLEVTARIRGMRYEIGNLSENDLVAVVNVDEVRTSGVYELPIEISAKDGTEFEILSVSHETVKVRFDYIKTKTFNLTAQAPNLSAAPGYMIDNITVNPQTVTITGPLEDIDKITKVAVQTNSTDKLTQSTSISGNDLILYDGNTVLDKSDYEFNRTSYNIVATVYSQKTIPLTFEFVEVPPGFDTEILEYELSDSTITLASPTSLENLDSWHIGYIRIKDIYPGASFAFDLNLSNEYKNISKVETVTVTFDSKEWETKTISIYNPQLHVVNAHSGFNITVQTSSIQNITVIGPGEILSELTYSDFVGEIDLNGASYYNGVTSVPVTVYAPDYPEVWCAGNYTAVIAMSEKVPEIDDSSSADESE